MKKHHLFLLIVLTAIIVWAVNHRISPPVEAEEIVLPNHQRETWISALEWCESGGNNNAVNPKDLDGTPSYYAFQFKPSTFKHFVIKYKMAPTDLEDVDYHNLMSIYEYQRNIVRRMIDDPEVRWSQQFPACTKKLGLPPK